MQVKNMTAPKHYCLQCMKEHGLHYLLDRFRKQHLIVECSHGHYAIKHRPGLAIPVRESKPLVKAEAAARQIQLF